MRALLTTLYHRPQARALGGCDSRAGRHRFERANMCGGGRESAEAVSSRWPSHSLLYFTPVRREYRNVGEVRYLICETCTVASGSRGDTRDCGHLCLTMSVGNVLKTY